MEGGKKIKIDSVQEKPMKVYLRILLTVYRQKKKKKPVKVNVVGHFSIRQKFHNVKNRKAMEEKKVIPEFLGKWRECSLSAFVENDL